MLTAPVCVALFLLSLATCAAILVGGMRLFLRDYFAVRILCARANERRRGGISAGMSNADVIGAYAFADVMLAVRAGKAEEVAAAVRFRNPPAQGRVDDPVAIQPDLVVEAGANGALRQVRA